MAHRPETALIETDIADLEIAVHRRDERRYSVDLRYTAPGGADDWDSDEATFDLAALRAAELDESAYGRLLADSLFATETLRTRFATADKASASEDYSLRLRLFLGPSSPELQSVRWERLRHPDPERDVPLLADPRYLFSRYLTSGDWRPVHLRTRTALRTLAVVASPPDLEQWQLAPIDPDLAMRQGAASLDESRIDHLTKPTETHLEAIVQRLQQQAYDVLYLVCHGALDPDDGRSVLYLSDPEGKKTRVVAGDELARRIEQLRIRPRLVVLASCESEGGHPSSPLETGDLAALGPRLAEAGIPAVLALHGQMAMDAATTFMSTFFSELGEDGLVDLAVAHARSAIQSHPDWWRPVLFQRLRSGRLWYTRGLSGDEAGGLDHWKSLLASIDRRRCTPILGPGLMEPLLGSGRDVVSGWARKEHYPLSPNDTESLPQVAQYVATLHSPLVARANFDRHFADELRRLWPDDLSRLVRERLRSQETPAESLEQATDERLDGLGFAEAIGLIGAERIEHDANNPHRVLAELGLPIYVTVLFNDLMADAIRLRRPGAEPQVEVYQWKEGYEDLWPPTRFTDGYVPSEEKPLVFHLFGHLTEEETWVLSEDDYFDYLLGMGRAGSGFPSRVGAALNNTSLLFLGFRMEDWAFRVLFRSIMNREGQGRRSIHRHVAVQIDPEEGQIQEPKTARRYLEEYFAAEGKNVSLYWGSAQDFVEDLLAKRSGVE